MHQSAFERLKEAASLLDIYHALFPVNKQILSLNSPLAIIVKCRMQGVWMWPACKIEELCSYLPPKWIFSYRFLKVNLGHWKTLQCLRLHTLYKHTWLYAAYLLNRISGEQFVNLSSEIRLWVKNVSGSFHWGQNVLQFVKWSQASFSEYDKTRGNPQG